jgi:uncharacterized membrane protein YccC
VALDREIVGRPPWANVAATLGARLRPLGPPLFIGVRLWVAACLALYLAYALQLGEPWWAGLTASLITLQVGTPLRKGRFRMVGTIIGALAGLTLAAMFPQDRILFLTGLALWGAACAFVAAMINDDAAYAAGIAGYTVAIVAGGALGATGGIDSDTVFQLAIARSSEIFIGIGCGILVRFVSETGDGKQQLESAMASAGGELLHALNETLAHGGPGDLSAGHDAQHRRLRQIIALKPMVDQTLGETYQLRALGPPLHRVIDALMQGVVALRDIDRHLATMPAGDARRQAERIARCLPSALPASATPATASDWLAAGQELQEKFETARRRLAELPDASPSMRLLADKTIAIIDAAHSVLSGLELATGLRRPGPAPSRRAYAGADPLPAVMNAFRVFAVAGFVSLLWIVTGWTSGSQTLGMAVAFTILQAARADQAYATVLLFTAGIVTDLILAAIVTFAVLPQIPSDFLSLSLVLGAILVPFGAMTLHPKMQVAVYFNIMALFFLVLLAPSNPMSYDALTFYNKAPSMVAGALISAVSFRLIPPLTPAQSLRRLEASVATELRRLAAGEAIRDWTGFMVGRLQRLPLAATPDQSDRLLAAWSVGSGVLRLREIAQATGTASDLERGLQAIGEGDSVSALTDLQRFDAKLASVGEPAAVAKLSLQGRAITLALADAMRLQAPRHQGVLA